jgi:hypothetical protein
LARILRHGGRAERRAHLQLEDDARREWFGRLGPRDCQQGHHAQRDSPDRGVWRSTPNTWRRHREILMALFQPLQ